jgi:hypothetical protein
MWACGPEPVNALFDADCGTLAHHAVLEVAHAAAGSAAAANYGLNDLLKLAARGSF